jgi:hypothetical protein
MKLSQRNSVHRFERLFDDYGTVMPCYSKFRETIQILSLAYGNNNNIKKFECLTQLRPSEVVVYVQLINDKDDIIILAPLIFQNNHLENL